MICKLAKNDNGFGGYLDKRKSEICLVTFLWPDTGFGGLGREEKIAQHKYIDNLGIMGKKKNPPPGGGGLYVILL